MNNHIKDRLYLFGSRDIPIKLLESLVEYDPERIIPRPDQCEECLGSETKILKKLIAVAREEMPSSRIKDWYLSSLAWYRTNPLDVMAFRKALRSLQMKSADEYRVRVGLGFKFAENVWGLFEKKGGIIT